MFNYGKVSQGAISAMSYLAERHVDGVPVRAEVVAEARQLSKPLAAKLLSQLSVAGLVSGAKGPGGGYILARRPEEICLFEIVSVFENPKDGPLCPFGADWCGNNNPCPLHDTLDAFGKQFVSFLRDTTLETFVVEKS